MLVIKHSRFLRHDSVHLVGSLLFGITLLAFPPCSADQCQLSACDGAPWAVTTTIFEPSFAIKQWSHQFPKSCLVVIGDRKSNETVWREYLVELSLKDRVAFLSADDQLRLPFRIMQELEWNHFARKNLGYLYAIQCKASLIYDFDDDNVLISDKETLLNDILLNKGFPVQEIRSQFHVFNPYMLFNPVDVNGSSAFMWPRGFPLDFISEPSTYRASFSGTVDSHEVAIFQSLADNDPDVDAIYRLTRKLPIHFASPKMAVTLPPRTFSPFNAQAVMFLPSAFWGFLLPSTVDGRVSDIWRSYITTRLIWETDARISFTSPFVIQYRNPHNYLKDFNAEDDLYHKTDSMLAALASFERLASESLSEAYLRLFSLLAEEGLVGSNDLKLARAWVQDLQDIGYAWPQPTRATRSFVPPESKTLDYRMKASAPFSYASAIAPASKEPQTAPAISGTFQAASGEEKVAGANEQQPALHAARAVGRPLQRKLAIWRSDLHVHADVASTLLDMGHTVLDMSVQKARGPPSPGQTLPARALAPVLEHLGSRAAQSTESDARSLFDYYKADALLASTDAFLCSFPAAICELFIPFNRSIVFAPSHRFLIGRCAPGSALRTIRNLQTLARSAAPRHAVVALGTYDQMYIKYFTGLDVPVLESTALVSTQNASYGQRRAEILVAPLQLKWIPAQAKGGLERIEQQSAWRFKAATELYRNPRLQDLAGHRAAVLLPHAVLSHGIAELYALGVPLFAPTVRLLLELSLIKDFSVWNPGGPHCGKSSKYGSATMRPPPQHPRSNFSHSPESHRQGDMAFWLQFADWNVWPHISLFDSWEELRLQLDRADLDATHARMLRENLQRKAAAHATLNEVLAQVDAGPRQVPSSYEQGLATYGFESIFVDP